jgi:hypothetical protein
MEKRREGEQDVEGWGLMSLARYHKWQIRYD